MSVSRVMILRYPFSDALSILSSSLFCSIQIQQDMGLQPRRHPIMGYCQLTVK